MPLRGGRNGSAPRALPESGPVSEPAPYLLHPIAQVRSGPDRTVDRPAVPNAHVGHLPDHSAASSTDAASASDSVRTRKNPEHLQSSAIGWHCCDRTNSQISGFRWSELESPPYEAATRTGSRLALGHLQGPVRTFRHCLDHLPSLVMPFWHNTRNCPPNCQNLAFHRAAPPRRNTCGYALAHAGRPYRPALWEVPTNERY